MELSDREILNEVFTRCKDGRWHIRGYGVVWEKQLIKTLKEIVPAEDCSGW